MSGLLGFWDMSKMSEHVRKGWDMLDHEINKSVDMKTCPFVLPECPGGEYVIYALRFSAPMGLI
jgi:hypothetical protein